MSDFITISRKEFEDFLPSSFKIFDGKKSQEIIYDIPTSEPKINVRVYSSIDKRNEASRGIGSDAIRVVLIDVNSGKPIDKSTRTHRMENWKERLNEKIEKLKNSVNSFKFCQECGSVMIARNGKFGTFLSCIRYPLCTGKMDASGKFKNGIQSSINIDKKVLCPKCNSLMRKINGQRGEFYGCTNYSKTGCRGTRKVTDVEINNQGVEESKNSNRNIQYDVPSDDSNIELIETKNYPHLNFKFEKFNPVQSQVFQYYNDDINCVVAAATSAGKTTIAEMFMADSIAKGKKAIFLSPLKAVSQEKYEDWTDRNHGFSELKVSIVTGDYVLTEKRIEELNNANIIIMTSEMLDSRTRRIKTEKNHWLLEAGVLVCDESHLLCTNRGHALESAIMRFTKQNFACRIIFLSATMPNVSELAKWLTFLNGKKTELINSNYRPIDLGVHYVLYNDYGKYAIKEQNKINKALEIIDQKLKLNEQVLVFVHSKNTGKIICEILKDKGVKTDFHSAELSLEKRNEISQKTKNKEIQVLIATSGLAWGINI